VADIPERAYARGADLAALLRDELRGCCDAYEQAKANRQTFDWEEHVIAAPWFVGRRYLDEVPLALEGKGIGNELAKAALDYARSEGLRVVPRCRFIAAYIKRHPQYQDLVEEKG